tara:strand:- start:1410 stop:2033 length:624 start_codon:yes stop_codon:yes gene_type:complete
MHKGWLGVVCMISAFNVNGAGVHEHGVGHLYMAIEGDNLQLILSLPVEDLAVTQANTSQQSSLQSLMSEPPLSFDTEGKCRLLSAKTEEPHDSHDAHDAHGSHAAHSEHDAHGTHGSHAAHSEHDAHGTHGSHAAHNEHDSHEAHANGGHSDVEINYLWKCSRPVFTAKTSLFKRFPRLYKINVQILSKNQQKVESLTPEKPNLEWH